MWLDVYISMTIRNIYDVYIIYKNKTLDSFSFHVSALNINKPNKMG